MPTLSVGRASNRGRGPGGAPAGFAGRGQGGVTLIEMMIVVAIVGLMVGITFPAVSAGLDSVRLASATDSLASFLNAAVESRGAPPATHGADHFPQGQPAHALLQRAWIHARVEAFRQASRSKPCCRGIPTIPKARGASFSCRAPRCRASGFRSPTAAVHGGSYGLTP